MKNSIDDALLATAPLSGEERQILAESLPVFAPKLQAAFNQICKQFKGQPEVVEHILTAMVANGHILIEGLPGLGKTKSAVVTRYTTGLEGQRISFTPDLLPLDILGTEEEPGPIFTQLLHADEINRAGPKVQTALLEAMQERQITLGRKTILLPQPFLVIATENPVEQEGTYPLGEAQLDRFLMKIHTSYPSAEVEEEIMIDSTTSIVNLKEWLELSAKGVSLKDLPDPDLRRDHVPAVCGPNDIRLMQKMAAKLPLTKEFSKAAIHIMRMSRPFITNTDSVAYGAGTKASQSYANVVRDRDILHCPKVIADSVAYGAGTRASQAFASVARARAFLRGDGVPTLEDLAAIIQPVLEPRIIMKFSSSLDKAKSIADIAQHLKRTL